MRKFIFLFVLISLSAESFSQAKKPTLMILPSDNWCVQRYFVTDFNNQGTKMKVPDYKQAFQEDNEIGLVISKIGALMVDRGFPLKDAEQEIKNLAQQSAEDAVTSSNATSSSIAESPLEKLKKRAKADIIIQISWNVNKTANGKSISFVLEALDAYTSKRIAASSGTGESSADKIVPVMLEESLLSRIDGFATQLQNHFSDMFDNGREITIRIKKWDSWDKNLETEINGEELSEFLNKWMQKNTVKGRFNATDVSENNMLLEQVRIPIYDDNKNAVDARSFLKKLQLYLKTAPFNIDSKLMIRGLGEAILVLGEK